MSRWTNADFEAAGRRRLARLQERADLDAELQLKRTGPGGSAKPTPRLIGDRLYPLILLCDAHGLPTPMPEYNFSPIRGYRFDYAFIPWKIAVEIEGGIWRKGGGAHSHPLGIVRDIEKYNLAARLGWRILRAQPEKLADLIEPLREMLV